MSLSIPHKADMLPEHANYRDRGCHHHPACLTCPFERCRLEVSISTQRSMAKAEKARALRANGLSIDAVAHEVGVSRRSVFRMLADARRR